MQVFPWGFDTQKPVLLETLILNNIDVTPGRLVKLFAYRDIAVP